MRVGDRLKINGRKAVVVAVISAYEFMVQYEDMSVHHVYHSNLIDPEMQIEKQEWKNPYDYTLDSSDDLTSSGLAYPSAWLG